MEDTDSWNIRARKDWFSTLLRRNRLEQESDTAHIEVEDLKVKKKVYLDQWAETQENPLFTKWCRERMDKVPPGEADFGELLQEKKGSSRQEQKKCKDPSSKIGSNRK